MAVTINGSTGISNVNGTAAAPAESSGAGNTGLYFPTTTTVGISTAGTNALYIDASQNVGIGTASPSAGAKLAVVGGGIQLSGGTTSQAGLRIQYASSVATISGINNDNNAYNPIAFLTSGTEAMRIDTSGNLLVGYTSSNGSYKLQVNSQIFATSSTIATSDANYKTNITPLTGALNLVQKLNPVSFNWKKHEVHNFDTETPTVGFLAQEVQSALEGQPYLNSIVKQSEVTLLDDTKQSFLGIAEGNMIALLTKAIQELSAEVTALKAKVGA